MHGCLETYALASSEMFEVTFLLFTLYHPSGRPICRPPDEDTSSQAASSSRTSSSVVAADDEQQGRGQEDELVPPPRYRAGSVGGSVTSAGGGADGRDEARDGSFHSISMINGVEPSDVNVALLKADMPDGGVSEGCEGGVWGCVELCGRMLRVEALHRGITTPYLRFRGAWLSQAWDGPLRYNRTVYFREYLSALRRPSSPEVWDPCIL